jgi:ribosomal protein S18 acetylase RimI-like enzyme
MFSLNAAVMISQDFEEVSIMSISKDKVEVRPMTRDDLEAIFSIDQEIRRKGQAYTYVNLTAERIFPAKKQASHPAAPDSHLDLIKDAVSELIDLGFVAEVEGHVQAFILGRIARARETDTEVGTVAILGVQSDYQRRGIATQLADTLCDKFRSGGIKTVRIAHRGVDRRDKPLLDFIERKRIRG